MERHGLDVIHLEVGQPDFETPGYIKQAAEKALRDGYTHYILDLKPSKWQNPEAALL